MRSNFMDDLIKVISRLVAFLRFCCSVNEMANVAEGHAKIFHELPIGGRHASRNVAETLRCDFLIARNHRSSAMKTSRMLFLT